jgi:hypothetical protein
MCNLKKKPCGTQTNELYTCVELAGENDSKTIYDLQRYWTSIAAILASLFSLAEWLKFLLQIILSSLDQTGILRRIHANSYPVLFLSLSPNLYRIPNRQSLILGSYL